MFLASVECIQGSETFFEYHGTLTGISLVPLLHFDRWYNQRYRRLQDHNADCTTYKSEVVVPEKYRSVSHDTQKMFQDLKYTLQTPKTSQNITSIILWHLETLWKNLRKTGFLPILGTLSFNLLGPGRVFSKKRCFFTKISIKSL